MISVNNKSVEALKVFTEVLRFLKVDALKTINVHLAGGKFTASDFTWVLTVPAYLKDFPKGFMVEAAIQAGLVTEDTKDKLMLALEPEAALTWCLKLPSDGFFTQNHSRDPQDPSAGPTGAGTSCNGTVWIYKVCHTIWSAVVLTLKFYHGGHFGPVSLSYCWIMNSDLN
ncbi:hypothetical protein CRENBAI_024197 [Crenichthys baileyi]|uniref:Uncharacterized protein n=1 Tax=Crenichthys baileyi TaxID=28760 RepID=A0AAV9S5T0_9TELE